MYTNNTIDLMFQKQQEAQIGQLRASRDQALGKINQEKAQITPMYQSQRNQSDVVSNQNANRLREIMAASGLRSSGENVTANTNMLNARQNGLNSINLQETQANNDIQRRVSDLNNPAEENSIIARIQAARNQALLEQMNRERQMAFEKAERDRQLEWEKQQFNTLSAYQKAQIEQQNRARSSGGGGGGQNYSKMYNDLLKQLAEQEYKKEVQNIKTSADYTVNRRNVPADLNKNYRPQF